MRRASRGRLDLNLNELSKDTTDVFLVESLLEPSKSIEKEFESVLIVTTEGKTFVGRVVSENGDEVTLLVSEDGLPRVTLARDQIDEMVPSKVSAMPTELVDELNNRQQFLDLVRYLMELAPLIQRH